MTNLFSCALIGTHCLLMVWSTQSLMGLRVQETHWPGVQASPADVCGEHLTRLRGPVDSKHQWSG